MERKRASRASSQSESAATSLSQHAPPSSNPLVASAFSSSSSTSAASAASASVGLAIRREAGVSADFLEFPSRLPPPSAGVALSQSPSIAASASSSSSSSTPRAVIQKHGDLLYSRSTGFFPLRLHPVAPMVIAMDLAVASSLPPGPPRLPVASAASTMKRTSPTRLECSTSTRENPLSPPSSRRSRVDEEGDDDDDDSEMPPVDWHVVDSGSFPDGASDDDDDEDDDEDDDLASYSSSVSGYLHAEQGCDNTDMCCSKVYQQQQLPVTTRLVLTTINNNRKTNNRTGQRRRRELQAGFALPPSLQTVKLRRRATSRLKSQE